MANEIELKPCPFCGCTLLSVNEPTCMSCLNCGASGPDFSATIDEAKNRWNTRAAEDHSGFAPILAALVARGLITQAESDRALKGIPLLRLSDSPQIQTPKL